MRHRSLGVVWKVKKYEEGIGTQNVILPNKPDLFSEWTCKQVPEHDYMGDFYFFKRTIENWPNKYDDIIWVEHVIATHHTPWVQQENIGNWEPL
jgi:hypothetical protein